MKTLRLTTLTALAAALGISPLEAADDEATLLAALSKDGVTLHAKAMACDQLGRIGTAKAVPALAGLLADHKLHDYARDALERIEDPAAGEALLVALETQRGMLQVGVIMSLGNRGEAAAVPALAKIASAKKASNVHVVPAALNALAQIANEDANKAILTALSRGDEVVKTSAAHAALAAAQRLDKAGKKDAAKELRRAVNAAGVLTPTKTAAR